MMIFCQWYDFRWFLHLFTYQYEDPTPFNIKFKNKYFKYAQTLLGGYQAWCGQCIFIVIMETGDLTGDFSFKTWKNRFLSQNLRFNLRFSKFMHFSKIHFILNLPLLWFLQKMIFHQYNLILNLWCNHDVKPHIMEHR